MLSIGAIFLLFALIRRSDATKVTGLLYLTPPTPAERSALATQLNKFGEIFASVQGLKKGDVLHLDWLPGVGTQCELNGKKLGEPIPDVAFYNAILRIWLGDDPVDSSLKPAMLGMK